MRTLIVVSFYIGLILLDYLPARQDKSKGETAAYWLILSASFCILVLYSLDIHVKGPTGLIRAVVGRLFPV